VEINEIRVSAINRQVSKNKKGTKDFLRASNQILLSYFTIMHICVGSLI